MAFGFRGGERTEAVVMTSEGPISTDEALNRLDPSDSAYEALASTRPSAPMLALRGLLRRVEQIFTGESRDA